MTIEQFIGWLTGASAVITAVNIYLMINKIWGRKHIKDVSESVSVSAYFLSFILGLPFFTKFVLYDGDYVAAGVYGMWMGFYMLYVFIGAGVWVAGKRRMSFRAKVMAALRLERDEVGTLMKAFTQPAAADQIIRILGGVAAIDRDFDERERSLIATVTESWGIRLSEADWLRMEQADGSYEDIHDGVIQYLATRPAVDDAGKLLDLINHMVRADQTVTDEEQLVLDEMEALIEHYMAGGEGIEADRYEALIVPQTEAQLGEIEAILGEREVKAEARLGGRVYPLGTFFSEAFAEAIAEPFRDRGLFSVVHHRMAEAG